MKTFNVALMVALVATASAVLASTVLSSTVRASTYDYNVHTQEDVVVGEEVVPAPNLGVQGVENYGVMPSWSNGCCDRQPSKADHLWDNYCFEKHSRCCKSRCCGKAYCGTGPFSKGCCCRSKGCRKISLPKLNVWNKCCQKASCCKSKVHSCTQKLHRPGILGRCCQKAKSCCQKAPCCKKSTCCQKAPCCQKPKCCQKAKGCVKSAHCRKPILSKFRLFRGCHSSKCCKGKGKGGVVVDSGYQGDALPAPAIEGDVIEMPNEVPVPPMVDPAA